MGDLTDANKRRIHHRLDASARGRRIESVIFVSVILIVGAFFAGYFLGVSSSRERVTPDWAKKAGEVREKALRGAKGK